MVDYKGFSINISSFKTLNGIKKFRIDSINSKIRNKFLEKIFTQYKTQKEALDRAKREVNKFLKKEQKEIKDTAKNIKKLFKTEFNNLNPVEKKKSVNKIRVFNKVVRDIERANSNNPYFINFVLKKASKLV